MGDIKMQLAEEAAAEERLSAQVASGSVPIQVPTNPAATAGDIAALSARIAALEQVLTTAQPAPAPSAAPEAIAAPAAPAAPEAIAAPPVEVASQSQPAPSQWRDEISFTLTPMQGTEYKLVMEAGAVADFEFVVDGGVVNYDAHGEGGGQSVTYEEVRGVANGSGQLVPPVSGTHGWFFRNRGDQDVTVTLRTGGQYSELRKLI
jgi:hypothetical protein